MTTVDPTLYADALAEIRALNPKQDADEPEPATPSCCTGDRRGYQWHQRNGIPACKESKAANAAYMRPYMQGYDARTGRTGGKQRRAMAAKRVA